MNPIYRWQEQRIIQALDHRRVILLAGARQCGKTTLARQLSETLTTSKNRPDPIYYTLDDITLSDATVSFGENLWAVPISTL